MSVIERFKRGRRVRTILSDNRTAGEKQIGSFIQLEGENFFRRVNSDGTLTQVGSEKDQYNYQNAPSKVRNDFIKSTGGVHGQYGNHLSDKISNLASLNGYKLISPILDKTGIQPKIQNFILRNTEGQGDWTELISLATLPFRSNQYDGKLHDNRYAISDGFLHASNIYSNNFKDDNRNLVNLYTEMIDKGFSPSKLGTGIYRTHPEYSKYPAYEGNYYNIDTLYLPIEAKAYFTSNINNRYNQDHDVLIKGMESVEGLDDVRNYQMTPRLINDKYYVDMEDVWNLDRAGFDSRNYPFILNQRLPVVFTEDKDKLNVTPELSNWFAVPKNWTK